MYYNTHLTHLMPIINFRYKEVHILQLNVKHANNPFCYKHVDWDEFSARTFETRSAVFVLTARLNRMLVRTMTGVSNYKRNSFNERLIVVVKESYQEMGTGPAGEVGPMASNNSMHLKGQYHQIFHLCFFSSNNFSWPQ
jgi:hypothetical protein